MRPTRVAAVAALGTMLFAAASGAQGPGRPWASKVPKELVRKANPLPYNKETVMAGKLVYENTCLPCHGDRALGDGPAAQFIVPPPKPLLVNGKLTVPDGVVFWVITNGIDGTGMASLGEAVTEPERWQVIRFLQAMGKGVVTTGTPAAPAPTPAVAPPEPVATAAPAGEIPPTPPADPAATPPAAEKTAPPPIAPGK